VYEKEKPAAKSGRRPATFLTRDEWAAAGKWLEASIGLSKTELLDRLAELGITSSSNRLKSYFGGEHLAEPETLEAICQAADISYVEAVDRFGYYREIVRLFDDLVRLGGEWLEEDDARGGTLGWHGEKTTRLNSLRDTGVLYWKGEPITWGHQLPGRDKPGLDPERTPELLRRYVVASWFVPERQAVRVAFPPIEFVAGGTFSLTVPYTLDRVNPSLKRETVTVEEHHGRTIVPKPIAVAILLAALGFPLRGDGYKEGAPEYRYNLGKAAGALVREATKLRAELRAAGRPKNLHSRLQRACDALDDRGVPFNYRRPVAAEYVVTWADALCRPFTRYARLAAFDFWGEAGGRSWTTTIGQLYTAPNEVKEVRIPVPSAFAMQPQNELADLPEIEMLTTYH